MLKFNGFVELLQRENVKVFSESGEPQEDAESSLENMAILSRTLFSLFSSLRQSLERRGALKERL